VLVGFHTEVSEALAALAAGAARVIALSACESALTEAADVVVPSVTWAEKDGLVVNFEGHVQRLRAGAIARAPGEWKVLAGLVASIEGSEPTASVGFVRRAIQENVAAFAGVDLVNVSKTGARLSEQALA
jgi:NADH dehydrogenase/NADH:ubiquinone oxidoreductase subunit G